MTTQPLCLPFTQAPMGAPPAAGGPVGGPLCTGGGGGSCAGGGSGGGGGCNAKMGGIPFPWNPSIPPFGGSQQNTSLPWPCPYDVVEVPDPE